MKLFKKWYVHESNWLFVPHTMAYDRVWGPMTRTEALDSALWHANQQVRLMHGLDSAERVNYDVTTERKTKAWL